MALAVEGIMDSMKDLYNQTMELRDRRVDGWFLMDSPWPTALMCVLYVYIVKFFGPKYMKDREPFEFRRLLVVYNLAMVAFSFYLFSELTKYGWGGHYNLSCQPVDYSNSPIALRMARACYWYFLSKFVEFADTIFFVLRKKHVQVTTLHVIHHGVMPMSVWFGVRFTPGGHSTFFGLLNTFVHVFMYFYYAISALGPKYQKYLWWKRYLTALQLLQFILVMVHSFQLLFIDCNYPRAFVFWIGGHAIMFFFLFADFYKSTYVKRIELRRLAEENRKRAGHAKQNGISNGHTKRE
jgi:elongation of very long chain fatty acids protein 7